MKKQHITILDHSSFHNLLFKIILLHLVTAKIVLFSGLAVGSSLAGFLSDYIGRKAAIAFFSQVLFGTGIIATVMPNVTGFIIVWFLVGKQSDQQTMVLNYRN